MSHLNAPSARYARLCLAFAAVPFVNALVAYASFPLVWHLYGRTGQPWAMAQEARSFALLAGFLSFGVTIGGVVPVVLWLMKRGPVSLGQLIIAGMILGNAPFLLFVGGLVLPVTLIRLTDGTLSQHLMPVSRLGGASLRALGIGSAFGGFSALVLWFLGIRQSAARESDPEVA